MATPSLGLTEQEAQARRARGMGNNVNMDTSRSYADIVRANVLNFINIVLFVIGAVMIAIGRTGDAVTSVGLVLLNVIIGMFQEIRAKRQLDRIALLTRPKVAIIRDGQEKEADPSEIVVGDVLVLRAGDQIVADGSMLGEGKLEVDESQLTGESDLIPKTDGAELMSGSFVVTGNGKMEVKRVGAESFANKLTHQARAFRLRKTPLQRDIDFVVRTLLFVATFLGFLLLISAVVVQLPIVRTVQMSAVVAGLIPNGLFFMVIVAYAMGALRIVNQGALVQQSNSIESLSNVNVLCMDKTGTLTTNRIRYHGIVPIGIDETRAKWLAGTLARSASAVNKTAEALIEGVEGEKLPTLDEVPFSSARKWSAVALETQGVLVLGALEMLESALDMPLSAEQLQHIENASAQGLRVLLLAGNTQARRLNQADERIELPRLTPLAIITFTDELRPHLQETLAGFRRAGVELKVISGDNPTTVAALARQAGFPADIQAISGTALEGLDDASFDRIAAQSTVFGRITPEQKERLVDSLRRRGRYVAMIGDGVNDVLSLKKADVGIAMQSGSAATRGVADMVLLGDNFGVLPAAFSEGQRIINGMQDILCLFLTRAAYVALLILATAVIGLGFPFVPKHISLLTLLTVGVPVFFLAVWARAGAKSHQSTIKTVLHFTFPAAFSVFFFGLLVYVGALVMALANADAELVTRAEIDAFVEFAGINYDLSLDMPEGEQLNPQGVTEAEAFGFLEEQAILIAQTALTTFSLFTGLLLILFVEPPLRWFVGGDGYSGDWRPTLVAGAMLGVYGLIVAITPLRKFFEIVNLPLWAYMALGGTALVWMLTVRLIWRRQLFSRFFNLETLRPDIDLSDDATPQYQEQA